MTYFFKTWPKISSFLVSHFNKFNFYLDKGVSTSSWNDTQMELKPIQIM